MSILRFPRPDPMPISPLPSFLVFVLLSPAVVDPAPGFPELAGDVRHEALAARPDTFENAEVRALIERARVERRAIAEGLESFEGRLRERIYVGFSATGFRRERGVYRQEQIGLIRWTRDGDRMVHWEGARRDIPIIGSSSTDSDEAAEQMMRELLGGVVPPPLTYEPGSDRILFAFDTGPVRTGGGAASALDPLADSAGLHYRFHSGDTLRITLPADDRVVTLAEVRVEPRRTEFRLLSASLWFDLESGRLVRAIYRPARPFDLELDAPDNTQRIPGFMLPIRIEVRAIAVDHSLQDLRWWIPRRFAFEAEGRIGGFARFPASIEWTLSEIDVNTDPTPAFDLDALPDGWRVQSTGRGVPATGASFNYIAIAPPADSLARGVAAAPMELGDRFAFDADELRELEEMIGGLTPSGGFFRLQTSLWPTPGLMRYNRVEGLTTGVAASAEIGGGRAFHGELRVARHDLVPTAELSFESGALGRSHRVGAYNRLVPSSEWDAPHSVGGSLSALVLGGSPNPFHRAAGVEAIGFRSAPRRDITVRLFAEHQSSAEKETDFHLRGMRGERELPPVLPSDEGWYVGAEATHRRQSGIDPRRVRLFTLTTVEGATGEQSYLRGRIDAGVTIPISRSWAGAVELATGGAVGDLPAQRRFFPGDALGYRGGRIGERSGDAFWLARVEVGPGIGAARISVFGDAVRTIEPDERFFARPDLAGGIGASLFDGTLRFDIARRLRPSGGWRLHFYMDGVF